MALQDLTPQLRTRLSRMERAVGWFILIATGLLLFGFGFYIYKTAERKGWFVKKINYQTSISSGAGLTVGDPVKLMGFDVGEITRIKPNKPYDYYNITVDFRINAPNFGYIWSDSIVKVEAGNFLGNRYLEVTKGIRGVPTIPTADGSNPGHILRYNHFKQRLQELSKQFTNQVDLFNALNKEALDNPAAYYTNLTVESAYWLDPDEAPALTERAQKLVSQVEAALPGILALTNQISLVLSNTASMTSNFNVVADAARPLATNLAAISERMRDEKGALGDLLLPTNINEQLETTLRTANTTFHDADTNLVALAENLRRSIDNLAGITSNLNAQVQTNTNIVSGLSDVIVHTDEFIQGLKQHWFLRSAFHEKTTNAPSSRNPSALPSPRARGAGQ